MATNHVNSHWLTGQVPHGCTRNFSYRIQPTSKPCPSRKKIFTVNLASASPLLSYAGVNPPSPPLVYSVNRKTPELIPPSQPTPYEYKLLSDIDDQKGVRKQNSNIAFFRNGVAMKDKDPVKIIRDALARTLVYFYPFAGRLREVANDKLAVECNGQGVLFIEADAPVELKQFGEVPHPPFPCVEELLYDVPGSSDILNCPLLLFQITRLRCGGVAIASRFNHSITDGTGITLFMSALAEIARGGSAPSVQPVWMRERLNAQSPHQITHIHRAYDDQILGDTQSKIPSGELCHRSFFFGFKEIDKLRKKLPANLKRCTKFTLLSACMWRCRTIALNPNPNDQVRLAFPVNARSRLRPRLPVGFYGNAFGCTVAVTSAGKLMTNPLEYAVELVREAIAEVTDDYMKSLANFLVRNGRKSFTTAGTFFVSDLTAMGLATLDCGFGKAEYIGPTWGGAPASFFISSKNKRGEAGILVPMDLPMETMEKFVLEVEQIIN